jgi:hypothetical protein
MNSSFTDTSPEANAFQLQLLRQASPARKLEMVAQMNATVRTLALAGLRSRYPNDPPEILHRRLADQILGAEMALKVYGPPTYGNK